MSTKPRKSKAVLQIVFAALGGLLVVTGLAGVIVTLVTKQTDTIERTIPGVSISVYDGTGECVLFIPQSLLKVEYDSRIGVGQAGQVILHLESTDGSAPDLICAGDKSAHIILEARTEIPYAFYRTTSHFYQSYEDTAPKSFIWDIEFSQPVDTINGMLRLNVRVIEADSSGASQNDLENWMLTSQALSFQSVSLYGLTYAQTRDLSLILLVCGLFFGGLSLLFRRPKQS